jgi:hypothetical protein
MIKMIITKYKIALDGLLESLENEVNRLIDMGWQPFGNMTMDKPVDWKNDVIDTNFIQPMVRYDE